MFASMLVFSLLSACSAAVGDDASEEVSKLAACSSPLPTGYDIGWTGNSSDSNRQWQQKDNWCASDRSDVPSASDAVVILAAAAIQPLLLTDVEVKKLKIESGASLDTNGQSLLVLESFEGDLDAIEGNGELVLAGTAQELSGDLPAKLKITGTALLTGDAANACESDSSITITITGIGANLTLEGHALDVCGDFKTLNGASIEMTQAADRLNLNTITATATFDGGNTEGKLSAGQVHSRVATVLFLAAGAFSSTGTDIFFDGTAPQAVPSRADLSSFLVLTA